MAALAPFYWTGARAVALPSRQALATHRKVE
jgi:hypothetical protein